jgi:uncharacterized protein YcgI (DUF1989 family)
MKPKYGKARYDLIVQPVSGRAVPVYRGEVLRIVQIEGGQCVDFNCYNLHDYKEYMSVGPSAGFRKVKGDVVMTRHPQNRPMLAILEMPRSCITDVIAPGCSATLFKRRTGIEDHTNCQHTFSQCIAEYGLNAEDIHNSFNLWMNSAWTEDGKYYSSPDRNTSKKGDYIDFLALMDVLAVPVICGGGDVSRGSNYWFKPIQIQIFETTSDLNALTQNYTGGYPAISLNEPVKPIRTERELQPIIGYQPHFKNFPLNIREFSIELTDEDYLNLQKLKYMGLGHDDEDALRSAVIEWYTNNYNMPDSPIPR